jgi:hypothetical protein
MKLHSVLIPQIVEIVLMRHAQAGTLVRESPAARKK